jgi:hypothetical protein
MIRVTIEMVPMGLGTPRHMATIEIANDVATTVATQGRRGDYIAKFSRISQRGRSAKEVGWYDRMGAVRGVSRTSSGAVYRIVHGVLEDFLRASR